MLAFGIGAGVVFMDAFSQEIEDKVPAVAPLSTEPSLAPSQPIISLSHEVRHEVAIPDGYAYAPLNEHRMRDPPARSYPFQLDPFQRLSVACIERNESVLVSAHTSAGKTVVAEYAIATALAARQRVIYTSPIKALSNQKYRELQAAFQDVGLMTGDVTINEQATCLVMTTEILRSMLYRGSEVMREVAWVVFDEIHYMRDKERGVVWEETLILLPDSVRYVFLSATIPNAKQFARWICKIHRQPCHVVYTNYRPTPLQHYLFPSGGDGIYLVVDERGTFREENFQKALSSFAQSSDSEVIGGDGGKRRRPPPRSRGSGQSGGTSDVYKIVKMIMSKNYQPVIIFSFSKRECENLAMQVSKLDFNTDEEKKLLKNIFTSAVESLGAEDRQLPQIEGILPLLLRGIGVHHSGLLPILKEVIEILFQEGLLKVLFATETFSIGLNMPARTVVFTNVRKFDGKDFRWVSGGEYIQMSGRAGRRGLDSRGIVIMMVGEKMEPAVAKGMVKGQADALNSAFHLGYNMIINLMRVEGVIPPEEMLERSFFQFQSGDSVPDLELRLSQLQAEYDAIPVEREPELQAYHQLKLQLQALRRDHQLVTMHPAYALPFLQPGRLVQVQDAASGASYGWCVVVNVQQRRSKGGDNKKKNGEETVQHVVDVLAWCVPGRNGSPPRPFVANSDAEDATKPEMLIIPVDLRIISAMSSVRIFLPKDLKPPESRFTVRRTVDEVERRFPSGLPLLDPIQDQGIKDEAFFKLQARLRTIEQSVASHPVNADVQLQAGYEHFLERDRVSQKMSRLRQEITQAHQILQMEELKCRKRVLRRLGYLDEEDVVQLKGRVACEISTGDELLLTELMFSGAFNDWTVEQCCAVLSCLVFEERSDEPPQLRDELAGPLRILHDHARRIAQVSQECRLSLPEEEYLQRFRPELMEVVFAWAKGAKFSKVCRMTDVFEGSIIRCMRRLEELLRQMASASHSIGNGELERKFNAGIERVKRDICFANSLYL